MSKHEIPEAAVAAGMHGPYRVTSTGQLFCFVDGCDWTGNVESGEQLNIQSWNEHHEVTT